MIKRVLHVVTIMNRGGAETMIMNYYRQMDRSKIQFDFLVHREERGVYDDEIEALGGKIYRTHPIRPWNYGKYRKWLNKFFDENSKYVAVHAHIQENSGFALEAAKKVGIPVRVSHSHIAPDYIDYKYVFRLYANRFLINNVTHRFACGDKAGKYLYKDKLFKVLPNAVDLSKFKYNPIIREKKRKELGVSNNLVVGNVARFHPVKNQIYLVDIFKSLYDKRKDAVLLLIGDGPEKEKVREKVRLLGLDKCVKFLDVRTDVNELLQAMDVFVFPSKLEGLPLSLIEAQASGLPCLLSNRVAEETAITDLVKFIPLEKQPDYWADTVLQLYLEERKDISEKIKDAHYDIESNAKWLQQFYLNEE